MEAIFVGGYFGSSITLGETTLTNKGSSDAMLLKIVAEMVVPEVQELVVENELKEFKITTAVEKIAGVKGGQISGEDSKVYERVKYEGESTQPITITPAEGYELVKITENGKVQELEKLNENEDGKTYTYPQFTDVKEDKHIVVTFAKTDEKFVINKTDEEGNPLAGAKFRIEQVDDRIVPQDAIKTLTGKGQEYYYINEENEITAEVLEEIVPSGSKYTTIDKVSEIKKEGMIGDLNDVEGEPNFVKNGEVIESNNYNQDSTTAHSYIPINLEGLNEKYVVVVNATVSSESRFDKGSASIEIDDSEEVEFMNISGEEQDDYTSTVLEGNKTYKLHLRYEKDGSSKNGADKLTINSIKVYSVNETVKSYEFTGEKPYTSNNQGQDNTVANSYIPIDLSNYADQKVAVVVNAQISSDGTCGTNYDNSMYANGDIGYATITENNEIVPEYNDAEGRFIFIAGNKEAQNYSTIVDGGTTYYLHLGYYKNGYENGYASDITDTFTINDVKVYGTKIETYGFREEQVQSGESTKKKYVSENKSKDNTTANSYVEINLQGLEGKYNLIINAEISSERGDYGYATITQDNNRVEYNNADKFIDISGKIKAKDYTTVLQGGETYYLHLGYYKDYNTNESTEVEDAFTINDIKVVLNKEDYYMQEAVTDEYGQIFLELEPADYSITEIEAPEGYELSESIIHTMEAGKSNEETIIDKKKSKVIVHHYLKDVYEEDGSNRKVADDEELYGTKDTEYETRPKVNLDMYELAKKENGEYDIEGNPKGTYTDEDQIVTYYYTKKEIQLTVHHYIEGTTNRVPLAEGGTAPDIISKGNEGDEYTAKSLSEDELDIRYELAEKPESEIVTYQYPEVEVIYYYRLARKTLLINKHAEDGKTPLAGATFEIQEINKEESTTEKLEQTENTEMSSKNNDYKCTTITTDESGQAKVELNAGKYSIKEIEPPEGYELTDEATQEIEINRLTEDPLQVNISNKKIVAKVIVGHYIYDDEKGEHTEERVPVKGGAESQDQIITGEIGEMYGTEPLEDLQRGYELYEIPTNRSGIMKKDITYVNYYYISSGVLITQNIEKDGSDIITSKDDEIYYKINYTAEIENYTGNALVTITDTLPYKLDKDKMRQKYIEKNPEKAENENWLQEVLKGGTYQETQNDENKPVYTITWEEQIGEINTQTEESVENITVEKDITVIFKEVNTNDKEFTNRVKGKIKLDATDQEQETPEVTHTTKTKYVKAVKVTKTWEHGANIYEKPTALKVYLKKINAEGEEETLEGYETILNQDNNWTHTFTNLPKYDEDGNEIQYTIEEEAVDGESLDYYKREI